MGMDGQLSIDEEGQKTGRKGNGVYCSPAQIFFAILISMAIVIAVGLLAFYLPDRTCSADDEPIIGTEPNKPEPTVPDNPGPEPTTHEGPTPTEGPWAGRLSYDVWPLRYDLTLTPYLYPEDVPENGRRFTFDGEVNIRVKCMEVTDMIVMHINNITIHELMVFSMSSTDGENLAAGYEEDELYQFLKIKLTTPMSKGEDYEVKIVYLGELSNGLAGFYRSTYTNEDGEEK